MSLTIELTPGEENAIRAAAAREGMDVTAFVREKLFAVAEPTPADAQTMTAFLQNTGNAATRAARDRLHAQGIGYVVADKNGAAVEQAPDGTANILPVTVP